MMGWGIWVDAVHGFDNTFRYSRGEVRSFFVMSSPTDLIILLQFGGAEADSLKVGYWNEVQTLLAVEGRVHIVSKGQ